MRLAIHAGALTAMVLAGGCKVADKHPAEPDAGLDAGGPVDTRAPDTRIDQAPDAFSNTGQATFRFSSDDPGATFVCRVDQEAAQPCQSPYVRTLPDGPHSFSVKAVDPAGNSDDTPAERLWTIDTVPPDTILLTGPPAADNSVTAQFTFRSSEDSVSFDCSIDNAGFLPCTSGQSFALAGDGAHSFAVRARDRAGNLDASPAIYAWAVDTRTPDTQILGGPPAASPTTTATFTFVSPDAGAGATFECSLDGAGFAACSSPQTYSGLKEAAHSFAVRVRDAVGNLDPTPATRSWTVDLTPPDTAITAGPSGTVPIASANLSFTSSEPGSTFGCSLDGAPFTACTSPAALTGLAQGPHTFAVRATDAAGHDDPSPATSSWTVDTVAPNIVITAGPGNATTSGPRVGFSFTVSDGAIACSLDGAGFAACASPFAVSLPAGPHSFAVRATDGAGNATTVTRSWTVACAPPDAGGAAGLLHLDDAGQTLANAVAGGAPATLGDTTAVEPGDPAALAAARFGGGLAFTAAEGDHVAWPVALPPQPELTIELWARPAGSAGSHDLLVSSDGRVALQVTAASPTAVQFSIAVTDGGPGGPGGMTHTVSSAAVAADAWHHVLASLQAPALRLWVDGVRTEAAGVMPGPLGLDAVRLGGAAATAYDGALDEVWLAQTAITSDDAALARYCPL
ncbi:MAG TPA: LamG-like jellyroll fold domain-containing protein [Kofleriaceae bacterium]|nr:LamG-like jellyroll fold domain-containing protein [Kofleriaceae bacterium]